MIFIIILCQILHGSETFFATLNELDSLYPSDDFSPVAIQLRQLSSTLFQEASVITSKLSRLHNDLAQCQQSYSLTLSMLAQKVAEFDSVLLQKDGILQQQLGQKDQIIQQQKNLNAELTNAIMRKDNELEYLESQMEEKDLSIKRQLEHSSTILMRNFPERLSKKEVRSMFKEGNIAVEILDEGYSALVKFANHNQMRRSCLANNRWWKCRKIATEASPDVLKETFQKPYVTVMIHSHAQPVRYVLFLETITGFSGFEDLGEDHLIDIELI